MSVKVIYFDAVGTLIHLPKGVGFHYADVARRQGYDFPANDFERAFFEIYREMPARPASHAPRPDDDKGWWRELVERVLDRCGIAESELNRNTYFEEVYDHFSHPGVWELFPEVRGVIEALESRVTLGIISNFDGRLRMILEQFGLLTCFSHIVISSEVGADKPDPWIFEHALSLANAWPEEALYVGDDPQRDWEAAEAVGLRLFKVNRPANSLRQLLALAGR